MRSTWMLLMMIAVTGQAFAQNRPNVIIMLADNVGYGDLGAYGAREIRGMPTPEFRGGSSGPFRGELGDALEGSLRVPATIRWPGRIAPRASNEMVSIHDFFPTLARIVGATVPADRPIDGVDQSAFFTGKQAWSNRESLITFVGDEITAVRWKYFRIYPKQFVSSAGNPSMAGGGGYRAEGVGYPSIFNIELDPREEMNIAASSGWVVGPYLKLIAEYQKSLEKYPNPKAVNMTQFGRVSP